MFPERQRNRLLLIDSIFGSMGMREDPSFPMQSIVLALVPMSSIEEIKTKRQVGRRQLDLIRKTIKVWLALDHMNKKLNKRKNPFLQFSKVNHQKVTSPNISINHVSKFKRTIRMIQYKSLKEKKIQKISIPQQVKGKKRRKVQYLRLKSLDLGMNQTTPLDQGIMT